MLEEYLYCCTLSTFGLDRAAFDEAVRGLATDGVELEFTERNLCGKIVVGKNDVDDVALENVLRKLSARISEYIYADCDVPLNQCLVAELKEIGAKLGIAESITGGMVSSEICGVEGASEIFYEGIVTYNSGAKVRRLHVPARIIEEKSAVSAETAAAMLKGVLSNKEITYAIATTGYASGADGLDGIAYVAYGMQERQCVDRVKFGGTRNEIRAKVTNCALFKLLKFIRTYAVNQY